MSDDELKKQYRILLDYLMGNRNIIEQKTATEDLRLICAFLGEIKKIADSAMIGAVDKSNDTVAK